MASVRASNLHLSIEASSNSFGFALLDTLGNRYVAVGYRNFAQALEGPALAERLAKEFEATGFTEFDYSKSSFAWISARATLVPDALFDEAYSSDYYILNHGPLIDETLYFEKVKGLGAFNIFSLPQAVEDFCAGTLKNFSVTHHSRVLLESLLLAGNHRGTHIYAHVQAGHFDLVITENELLKLYNYYTYTSAEDFVYHTLNTCKQLGYNPQQITLTLLGEIEAQSTLNDLLSKYVSRVVYHTPAPFYTLGLGLEKLPRHFYFNLFNQYLCVS